ncbi:MAG: flagellar FlbD family protein [bacterium]
MIFITKLNSQKIVVNAELIEFIEETPETMITMTTGKKFVVKEKIDEIVALVKKYKKELNLPIIKEN